jgi:small-conductance mechanosensitive channel
MASPKAIGKVYYATKNYFVTMVEEDSDEFEDVEKNNIKNILWYLIFIIGLGLIVLYGEVFYTLGDFQMLLLPWIPKIAFSLLTIFVVNLFIRLSRPIIRKAYILHSRGGKLGNWKAIRHIYTYVVWALTGLIIFTGIFGSISSLGISLGIIGAGLAFALQQPILSFTGFFLIMIKRPFTIGDRIILSKEGVMGDVEDITLFFFILKEVTAEESKTGKSIIVPNSVVFQGSLVNYSYDTPHIWQSIPVSITYDSDLELAQTLLSEAALKIAGKEMKRGARLAKRLAPDSVQSDLITDTPQIRVEFADSSIDLNIRIMNLPKKVRKFRTEIYKEVFRLFKLPENRDKVEIAYPHMELVAHESLKQAIKK